MSELINIRIEDGIKAVSAKELYTGLGLGKRDWSRWYPKNIQGNDYFEENVDWTGFSIMLNGNESMDFLISLDFAKHIAMMARTKNSHEYRNYFIQCERENKQVAPRLSKEVQAIFALDQRTVAIDNRLTTLEGTMTIDYSQQEELRTIANKKVVGILGGKDAPAYKECNKKAFSELWKSFKRVMQVNSYRNTAAKEHGTAREVISNWKPNRDLELMILGANSQLKINL